MLIAHRTIQIEWGDCDPAGIVHYPRYFFYFDACTAGLFQRATGMKKAEMLAHYGIVGFPMVDTRARFLAPSRYGDEVLVESTITEFRRSSFDVRHRLNRDGTLAVECFETRVWAAADPDRPGAIKGQALPAALVALFDGG